MAKIAVMGFGTVGSGVYEIIKNQKFQDKSGEITQVKYILDIRDFENNEIKPLLTKDFNDILNDDEISIAAEVMGGLHPAYEFTKQLLEKGVSVVTSNKELVATYGPELLQTAKDNDALYLFEASVGGGIPIIRPMSICTKANKIERIAGILNGTTNYILNEMFEKNKTFESALKDAQTKGYAEKNPAADIEGYDACRKIAILASMAWGKFVDYNEIETEGITDITSDDVEYAKEINSVIKLIGYADIDSNGKVYAAVQPMIVPDEIILSRVNGVFNAVMLRGNYLGDALFYGRGAGKEATASAVVADILDCQRHLGESKHNIEWEVSNGDIMQNPDDRINSFFVRCRDTESKAAEIFADAKFLSTKNGETAFTVGNIKQSYMKKALAELNVVKVIKILE